MPSTQQFNYADIIHGVNSGTIDTLYVIQADYHEDDEHNPEYYDTKTYFAGTTLDECRATINHLVATTHPDDYTRIDFFAQQFSVTPDSLTPDTLSSTPDSSTPESIIDQLIFDSFDTFDNAGTDDWNHATIRSDYKPMKDGIALYWSWRVHPGCIRQFIKFSYVTDPNLTTLHCKPVTRTDTTQCTLLVTPTEMHSLTSATALRTLINERLTILGNWTNIPPVDDFLRDLYTPTTSPDPSLLPTNDLYKLL